MKFYCFPKINLWWCYVMLCWWCLEKYRIAFILLKGSLGLLRVFFA